MVETWTELAIGEDSKTGSRKFPRTSVTPGIWISPPNRAPKARMLIAIFIGHSRSAMWCSSPGKPTS